MDSFSLKRICALIVFVIFASLCFTGVALADSREGIVRADVGLNLRTGPGTDYDVIIIIPNGSGITIDIENCVESWAHVIYGDYSGYVASRYVEFRDGASRAGFYDRSAPGGDADELIEIAKGYLGSRYVYGGTSPSGFDCSGFTQYVYRKMGYSLNRVASSQALQGERVSRDNLQKGDLVFFGSPGGSGSIWHVGIYIGDNKFIHAENSRTGVVITSLSASYYNSRYVKACRLLK